MKTKLGQLLAVLVLLVGFSILTAEPLSAQTFTNLHNFLGGKEGSNPYAGLVLSGKTLYGTTFSGGSSNAGTVFAVNTDGTRFTNLYSFSGDSDGGTPSGGLVLSGKILYGTAYSGGDGYSGTVFAVNTNGQSYNVLYSFSGDPFDVGDGRFPYAGLILSGDTLYGTTLDGGTNDTGTVFKINTNGPAFTFSNLYNFSTFAQGPGGDNTNSDGIQPQAGLILSGNTLYGTTINCGMLSGGTVFAVNTDGTSFTNLHNFKPTSDGDPISDGESPVGGLILSGSTLYGTTSQGTTNHSGTVFAINTNGSGFTTLHVFTGLSDGGSPQAGLILSGNTLYGTTVIGGSSGNGTVFAVSTDGKTFTNIYNFSPTDSNGFNNDGASPLAGLLLSGNTLYGTTSAGGTNGNGTVFSISLASVSISVPPRLTPLNYTNEHFALLLTGTAGTNYIIQVSTNLAVNNWISVITNLATNGTFNFTDTHATNQNRFYRAMQH